MTVCGTVASTNFAARSKGQPTYLNLDRPYPNQVFTVLIWGSDRPKFGAPETTLMGKKLCATGTIKAYRGKPGDSRNGSKADLNAMSLTGLPGDQQHKIMLRINVLSAISLRVCRWCQ